MAFFVDKNSIVRTIWGKADTVLLIFAGASAEFALNKAVDWLYYTGRLPSDPLGRLFSTVAYAKKIIFSDYDEAVYAIDKITAIHKSVEHSRADKIPDWAYRDVLFMLADYSMRSFELLERKLTLDEKEEIVNVFNRLGSRMAIKELPSNYSAWRLRRNEHLKLDLIYSNFTKDLYKQYAKHLGFGRYQLLKQTQKLIVPVRVRLLLSLDSFPWLRIFVGVYKLVRYLKLDGYLKLAILSKDFRTQIKALDSL